MGAAYGIMVNVISRLLGSDYKGLIYYLLLYKNCFYGVIWFMGSDMVWPEVIPLSGAYCI
jgi:hypothetical protein